jgi:O-antigen biosynthesis protein
MRIVFIHDVLPRWDLSGSELRVAQIVHELAAQGHAVTYVARFGLCDPKYLHALEKAGITVFAHDADRLRFQGIDAPRRWSIEDVLHNARYDLAILSLWFWNGISVPEHYMGEIRRLSPETKIAVLTDDRHGLRESRLARLAGLVSDSERAKDFYKREQEVYRRADVVVCISSADRDDLISTSPQLSVEVIPMAAEGGCCSLPFEQRNGLLFLGDFDNSANHDGIAWFLRECWPTIRQQIGDVRFCIVGNNAPMELADEGRGILCKGQLQDLGPVLCQARVFVCPVRFGTGVSTKNLIALSHGLPVVTTPSGAEGLNAQPGRHVLICDTREEFVNSVVKLYTDPAFWQIMSRAGREHVQQVFAWGALRSQLHRIINNNLPQVARNPRDAATWSVMAVERHYPDVLTFQPSYNRVVRRCWAHMHLADRSMLRGDPAEALNQARHVFSFFKTDQQISELYPSLMNQMDRYYRELGDIEAAEQCAAQV